MTSNVFLHMAGNHKQVPKHIVFLVNETLVAPLAPSGIFKVKFIIPSRLFDALCGLIFQLPSLYALPQRCGNLCLLIAFTHSSVSSYIHASAHSASAS